MTTPQSSLAHFRAELYQTFGLRRDALADSLNEIDGSTWPRPEAKTSPKRTCCRFVTPGAPENGIMPRREYQ